MDASANTQKIRSIRRVLWITLLLNLVVALAKLLYGHSTQMLSMVADGYHSLLDSSSNVVGLIAIAFASKTADHHHPYGHHKIEAIAAMFISGMLFLACYEIASSAYARFFSHDLPQVTWISFLIMLATMGINFGVSRYEEKQGKKLKSQILMADSAHTRSDVFASLSVLIALLGIHFHLSWLDLAAAGFITLFVGYSGYHIVMESLDTLLDSAQLDPQMIKALALEVPGVCKCHNVRTRGHAMAVYMDLNIHVSPELSTEKAHEIAHAVIAKIKSALPQVVDVIVHTEPNTRKHS